MRKLKFTVKKPLPEGESTESYAFEATSARQRLILYRFPPDANEATRVTKLRMLAEIMGTDFVIIGLNDGESIEVWEESDP